MWIAVGSSVDTNAAYSYDGFTWTLFMIDLLPYNSIVYGIAFNSRRPYTLTFSTTSASSIIGTVSSSVSYTISVLSTSRLDVVSDAYYNGGYTNFSITMNASRS